MGNDDFDFLHGRWRVAHHKLATRLNNADDWFEFEGTSETKPILQGTGNVEDNMLDDPTGPYKAAALRHYSHSDGLWRIWWLDERFPGNIGAPVTGSFEGNEGIFETEDLWNGQSVILRFRWTKDRGDGCPRWEQSMSPDGGQTWEVNWTMIFHRLPD